MLTSNDMERLQGASKSWRTAQIDWLQVAQGMSAAEAQATMEDFARNEMHLWMNEHRPGPPPLILFRYHKEA